MPANPVKIGPFNGGLNTYSDTTAVGDTECVDIQNFNVDLDGSLYSRPPITVKVASGAANCIPGTARAKILGWFVDPTTNERYLIVSGTGTYARKQSDGTWITITNTISATAMVQYANKAFLIAAPTSVSSGGTWTPSGGFVAVAAMAKGASAIIYKERLFIAGGRLDTTNANRVWFSDAAVLGWTGTNFFDVRAGDGQGIVVIRGFQDTIVVFKEDSTYVYSYDSQPTRGAVRNINTVIGCSSSNCVAEYENNMYVYHEGNVYQINNWNFTLLNLKVPFDVIIKDASLPKDATLSVVADMLIVRTFDGIYVFGLKTGTWTKWDSTLLFDFFIQIPVVNSSDPDEFYACGRVVPASQAGDLYSFVNGYSIGASESMTCYVITKTFDFGVPYTFKRLFWWGVDMISKKDLTYTVYPVSYARSVSHAQMAAYTHAQLAAGTHISPLSLSIDVTDSLLISNAGANRMFAKLLKGLRFRQVSFKLQGTTNGTSTEGPLRVYGITAFIDNKQVVDKSVN